MYVSSFSRIVPVVFVLALSACATPPRHINNICTVFEQRDGLFNNWQRAAERTERKYGIPKHVLMATIRKESGFKSNAKPPRTKLLGFIPWKRVSTAYGYSQALNGTWSQYKLETGSFGARRSNFADAADFVGWYHSKTVANHGVARDDAYRLYLAYYLGWTGYKRGNWNDGVQRYARDTQKMADRYRAQMRQCR